MNCYCDCKLCGDYENCEIRKSENPDKKTVIISLDKWEKCPYKHNDDLTCEDCIYEENGKCCYDDF